MSRQYPLNRYVLGDYKRSCDRCGWDYLRSELIKEWNGFIVCKERCFEPKQPLLDPPVIIERPLKIEAGPSTPTTITRFLIVDDFTFLVIDDIGTRITYDQDIQVPA